MFYTCGPNEAMVVSGKAVAFIFQFAMKIKECLGLFTHFLIPDWLSLKVDNMFIKSFRTSR